MSPKPSYKFRNQINLIPRNNWDYKFEAVFSALVRIRKDETQTGNVLHVFQKRPIWTTSGRASLYAVMKALELPTGSKVGVPLFCCSVVFNAICQAGLIPCFIDSNMEDYNLSPEDLLKKRKDLAAIVAVHMFGNPCDMDEINDIADTIPVIEDCAQSVFSTYKGKLTGLLSTASFFSFRCGKYISSGEGSAIFCQNPELQAKIEKIVDSFEPWTKSRMVVNSLSTFVKATLYNRPWYGLVGYPIGMRLDKKLNLTAKDGFETGKIASTHLALIDKRIARFTEKIDIQSQHAKMLLETIKPCKFSLPVESNNGCGNWFQFALRFQSPVQRDAMADHLLSRGIDTAKYLDTITEEARSSYGYKGDCPNAELLSKTTLLIPIHYTLNARNIEHIVSSINQYSQGI